VYTLTIMLFDTRMQARCTCHNQPHFFFGGGQRTLGAVLTVHIVK